MTKAVIKFGKQLYNSFSSFYTVERNIGSLDVLISRDRLLGLIDNALFHESTIVRDFGDGRIEAIKDVFSHLEDFNLSIIDSDMSKDGQSWSCYYDFWATAKVGRRAEKFTVSIDVSKSMHYNLDKMIGQVD